MSSAWHSLLTLPRIHVRCPRTAPDGKSELHFSFHRTQVRSLPCPVSKSVALCYLDLSKLIYVFLALAKQKQAEVWPRFQSLLKLLEVLSALGQLCLWQCLGSWCNIHISLKNNNDLVLMMTVMMRPSRLNVERGASQIRLTGLAYKKRTSDFNGWQMRVFPPNTTIPRWSYRAHLCNHQNKLCPGPQTGAGESRDYPHAHKSGEKSDIFLPGQPWSINQLNGSLLPSLPLLMVQTHDTATTKATTQMQNAPKTLQHYHMCIVHNHNHTTNL